ncbi:MAG: hypothetical protein HYS81_03920 [Candidatus Aenigmatarchaeota archaeon]|nr:MAG: hypothetical protein HYS81_03920 [Candidatus Aenigmarchaeota archaeon]
MATKSAWGPPRDMEKARAYDALEATIHKKYGARIHLADLILEGEDWAGDKVITRGYFTAEPAYALHTKPKEGSKFLPIKPLVEVPKKIAAKKFPLVDVSGPVRKVAGEYGIHARHVIPLIDYGSVPRQWKPRLPY